VPVVTNDDSFNSACFRSSTVAHICSRALANCVLGGLLALLRVTMLTLLMCRTTFSCVNLPWKSQSPRIELVISYLPRLSAL
jgi:hypothetical protein